MKHLQLLTLGLAQHKQRVLGIRVDLSHVPELATHAGGDAHLDRAERSHEALMLKEVDVFDGEGPRYSTRRAGGGCTPGHYEVVIGRAVGGVQVEQVVFGTVELDVHPLSGQVAGGENAVAALVVRLALDSDREDVLGDELADMAALRGASDKRRDLVCNLLMSAEQVGELCKLRHDIPSHSPS